LAILKKLFELEMISKVKLIPELKISEVEMISELQQAVKTQGKHDIMVD